jgi:hypothetical protein
MGDHWFRFCDSVVQDVKVQGLPAPTFKLWVNVLCIASDNGGCLPALNAIAFALRVDEAAALVAITTLRKAGLLDLGEGGALTPHNWDGRQFITDEADGSGTPAAVRAKKWRAKKAAEKAALELEANGSSNAFANGSANVQPNAPNTIANVTASRPDTDTDTETDTDPEKGKKGSREVALAPSDWPNDWFDRFWKKYPNKVDRAGAMKSLAKVAKKGGIEWSRIIDGLDAYVAKTDDRPWCNPTTWINQARWDHRPAEVAPHGKAKTGGSIIDALRDQAEFFQRKVDAERAAADDLEAGGDDVLGLPAE